MKNIKTRFPPSPTGYLHIGGLRTALYNFLLARANNGKFLLRLEDTDQKRYVPDAAVDIITTLQTFGLNWDEGVNITNNQIVSQGEYGPYEQSKRLPIYQKYAAELVAQRKAYCCFCSAERLAKMREMQTAQKKAPRYDKHCLKLDHQEVTKKLKNLESHTIRLNIPVNQVITFHDLVRGDVQFNTNDIDDQILIKSDGFPTYHLANVVDDHEMRISHVVRGEEWLPSTPKHILLYRAFGWDLPYFAHLPLLLNPDKSKLSKRAGDVAAREYLAKGYLPSALLNFVLLLGWNPGDEREIFTLDEMIKNFSLERVHKAGAVFDLEKLNWLNSVYIKKMDLAQLTQLCLPYLPQNNFNKQKLEQIIALEQERIKILAEISAKTHFFFQAPQYDTKLLFWKQMNADDVSRNLEIALNTIENINPVDFTAAKIQEAFARLIRKQNLNNGEILWPLRVALSGEQASPPPFDIAAILGPTESVARVKIAVDKIKNPAL